MANPKHDASSSKDLCDALLAFAAVASALHNHLGASASFHSLFSLFLLCLYPISPPHLACLVFSYFQYAKQRARCLHRTCPTTRKTDRSRTSRRLRLIRQRVGVPQAMYQMAELLVNTRSCRKEVMAWQDRLQLLRMATQGMSPLGPMCCLLNSAPNLHHFPKRNHKPSSASYAPSHNEQIIAHIHRTGFNMGVCTVCLCTIENKRLLTRRIRNTPILSL